MRRTLQSDMWVLLIDDHFQWMIAAPMHLQDMRLFRFLFWMGAALSITQLA